MPRDHSAMMRGLAEQLIVPETHRTSEQLRRRQQKRRIPKQVMKPRRDPPRTQCMKEHRFRTGSFVGMKFVEKMVAGMIWIDQLCKFGPQFLNLIVIQRVNAGKVSIAVKELDLLVS